MKQHNRSKTKKIEKLFDVQFMLANSEPEKEQPVFKLHEYHQDKSWKQMSKYTKKKKVLLKYMKINFYHTFFLYIFWFPEMSEKDIQQRSYHCFKKFYPSMHIKTKNWNKKKRQETKKPLIIVVNNYVKEVDINKCYNHIYKTAWINFCYVNKKLILKQDMTTEQRKKYVNHLYFGDLLPMIDEKLQKVKKNNKRKQQKTVLKKMNMIKFVD